MKGIGMFWLCNNNEMVRGKMRTLGLPPMRGKLGRIDIKRTMVKSRKCCGTHGTRNNSRVFVSLLICQFPLCSVGSMSLSESVVAEFDGRVVVEYGKT